MSIVAEEKPIEILQIDESVAHQQAAQLRKASRRAPQ